MSDVKNKSHARISYMPLETPNAFPANAEERKKWLDEVIAGFVSPSKKNKEYYAVILKTLWPNGYGIPGPLVEESALRKAVDSYRGAPYVDTFRRMRELQGEEGLLGIVKGGNKYQLISLEISPKRIPRTHLNGADWGTLLERYGNVCAACGRSPSQKGFQQDHKIPRLRGGGDEFDNWQPLCDECNNFKSTACRDCQLDCKKCCWAFPEKYKPLHISGELIAQLYEAAHKLNQNPNSIVERMIELWIKEQQGDASIK